MTPFMLLGNVGHGCEVLLLPFVAALFSSIATSGCFRRFDHRGGAMARPWEGDVVVVVVVAVGCWSYLWLLAAVFANMGLTSGAVLKGMVTRCWASREYGHTGD